MSKMQNPTRTNVSSKIAAAAPKPHPSTSIGEALAQQEPKQVKIVKA
jgi:hypothetical protein